MKDKMLRYAPPNVSLEHQLNVFWLGEMASAIISLFVYLSRYFQARQELYLLGGQLNPQAVMLPFGMLIDRVMLGFLILGVGMLLLVVINYLSYRQESMSVYLMRRLPDRSLMHRQCWTLPLVGIAICILSAAALTAIYYWVYRTFTPAACLPAEIWRAAL